MNIAEGALLYKMCKLFSDRESTFVEIGRKFGGSTILMASCLHKESKLYSIDIEYRSCVSNNIAKTQKQNQIILIHDSSENVAKNWKIPIDLIFIDGNHSKLAVKQDIKLWLKHVKSGGFSIFHDVVNHKKSLWLLMKKLMLNNWYKYISIDTLLCLKKK